MGKKTRQSREKVEVLIRLRSEINEIENRAAREKSLKQTNKQTKLFFGKTVIEIV